MKIRAKKPAKCPKCGGKWQNIEGIAIFCPKCLTTPQRFYVDLSWKGRRIRVYSFKDGQPLSSWELAKRAQKLIEQEIATNTFDPSKWVKGELEQFLVRTLVERYIEDRKQDIKPSSLRKKRI